LGCGSPNVGGKPQAYTRSPRARELLGGAAEELSVALEELRELARGLHPAVLTERGLRAAVESLVSRVPVPLEIVEMPAERLAEPIEEAAYDLLAEGLTNVARYARACLADPSTPLSNPEWGGLSVLCVAVSHAVPADRSRPSPRQEFG
jgi:hypothetical protein